METRITDLESTGQKHDKELPTRRREAARIDHAIVNKAREMREMRHRNDKIEKQLLATQWVVKKLAKENNQYGRTLKSYNLRIRNLKGPLAQDHTGNERGAKPREDTKHFVVKFIEDNKL